MKTILTPHLLGFLIERGYSYCLAKTQSITKLNASVSITLTPVKIKPSLDKLPPGYDTYFKITREPMQMACGVDDTEIYVSLDLKKGRTEDSSSRISHMNGKSKFYAFP